MRRNGRRTVHRFEWSQRIVSVKQLASTTGPSIARITSNAEIKNVESLAIDPQNTSTIYASCSGGGVYKSVDGGANWSAANAG